MFTLLITWGSDYCGAKLTFLKQNVVYDKPMKLYIVQERDWEQGGCWALMIKMVVNRAGKFRLFPADKDCSMIWLAEDYLPWHPDHDDFKRQFGVSSKQLEDYRITYECQYGCGPDPDIHSNFEIIPMNSKFIGDAKPCICCHSQLPNDAKQTLTLGEMSHSENVWISQVLYQGNVPDYVTFNCCDSCFEKYHGKDVSEDEEAEEDEKE